MNKIITYILTLCCLVFASCEDSNDNGNITVTATIVKSGEQPVDGMHELYFDRGDNVEYRFKVSAPNGIKKIELSEFKGVGINQSAPIIVNTFEDMDQIEWEYTGTVTGITNDIRFSIYVQDTQGNYTTIRVSAMLRLTCYLSPVILYDGLKDATSKTFLNLETGRTFSLGQTTIDPENMDLGFAYIEQNAQLKACLVSMDSYWLTGVYPMVANKLNPSTEFRKVAVAQIPIEAFVTKVNELQSIFDTATPYDAVEGFDAGKIASGIQSGDVIAFKNRHGAIGLIEVTALDNKGEASNNTQEMRFKIIIENRYAK